MTKPDRKYVRVYFDDLAHEYPMVWEDRTLGWTWLRLLVVAEKMWPTVPEVPRWVKPRALARLVEVGIVTLVEPHGFRVKGLDAERTRRAAQAKKAAAERWGAKGNAQSIATGDADVECLDETNQAKTKLHKAVKEMKPTPIRSVEPMEYRRWSDEAVG